MPKKKKGPAPAASSAEDKWKELDRVVKAAETVEQGCGQAKASNELGQDKHSKKGSGQGSSQGSIKSGKGDLSKEDQAAVEGEDAAQLLMDNAAELLMENMDEDPEVSMLKVQLADAQQQVLLARAQTKNHEERTSREMVKARQFANERIIKKLLPVLDTMTRGLEAAPSADPQVQTLRQGMELTLDMLLKVMQEFGVEVIAPGQGDAFNPDQHEAMSVHQDKDQADNTVYRVLQNGYMLQDRVLRAAMVIVNRVE